jgi:ring-1,2-phenylacetyl-CoA epoxidase subunit PaaC
VNELLLGLADDELILGWRDSEWTGIAPLLEEDVAFSSIAQNEIGHARALYELLTDDPDALAFDRTPEEYRCAPLVELRLLDWAHAIARRWLYETADEIRIAALMGDPEAGGLATKIDREEAYHRMHAELWHERLRDDPRFRAAVEELWPYAVGLLPEEQREELARRTALELPSDSLLLGKKRGSHVPELQELWEEMTMVRRSAPAGAQW